MKLGLCLVAFSLVLTVGDAQGRIYDAEMARLLSYYSGAAYSSNPQSCAPYVSFNVTGIAKGVLSYFGIQYEVFAYTGIDLQYKRIITAFRGSEDLLQVVIEGLGVTLDPYPFNSTMGSTCNYFTSAMIALYPQVSAHVRNAMAAYPSLPTYITGHSLGGALAALTAFELIRSQATSADHLSLYTFGQPRVGDANFVANFNKRVLTSFRVVHYDDFVVRVPPSSPFPFLHHNFEVFYPELMELDYKVCLNGGQLGEDPSCSNDILFPIGLDTHYSYFNKRLGTMCASGCGQSLPFACYDNVSGGPCCGPDLPSCCVNNFQIHCHSFEKTVCCSMLGGITWGCPASKSACCGERDKCCPADRPVCCGDDCCKTTCRLGRCVD